MIGLDGLRNGTSIRERRSFIFLQSMELLNSNDVCRRDIVSSDNIWLLKVIVGVVTLVLK